jgi:hypothetical protein
MSSETVVTYKCDRPGCGRNGLAAVEVGSIKFSTYVNRRGIAVPDGGAKGGVDVCTSCQSELIEYWFKLTK